MTNTLGIDTSHLKIYEISKASDFDNLPEGKTLLPIGKGSNLLITSNFDGSFVRSTDESIEIVSEDEKSVTVLCGGGVDWPTFVIWAVDRDLSGVENLAYVPGTVGAAPVQNIACYGQVFEDVFVKLEAVELSTGKVREFDREQLEFAYRTSVFKTKEKMKYLVTRVWIVLSKESKGDTGYHSRFKNEALEVWLEKLGKEAPYSPKDIAEAVTALRQYKLPEVGELGTCGSFFKNPFVTIEKYRELSEKIENLQAYPTTKMKYPDGDWLDQVEEVKIPAGHLLDSLGWKGKWVGNVATFDKHALCVITNFKATGDEVLAYVEDMKKSVREAYGIELEAEVVVL